MCLCGVMLSLSKHSPFDRLRVPFDRLRVTIFFQQPFDKLRVTTLGLIVGKQPFDKLRVTTLGGCTMSC